MDTYFPPPSKDRNRKQEKIKRRFFLAVLLLTVLPQVATIFNVNTATSRKLAELAVPKESPFDIGALLSYASTMIYTERKSTKIIGFSDKGYKEIAWNWYQEMEQLGYNEHLVVAQDRVAAAYFEEKGMRYDLVHPASNSSLREECDKEYSEFPPAKKVQTYRRMLFGSRWNYVLRQLKAGHPILMTDVDNVFTRYIPLTEMEDSEFDVFHAYAGLFNSFPRTVFRKMGFTVCGGMSWLRPVSGVMEFVNNIVQRCNCEVLQCSCHCDDQVVTNEMIFKHPEYKYVWDTPLVIPKSEEEVSWEGKTGKCTKTGHRVKVWDRHVAFRCDLDPKVCPDPNKNWIAMPTGVDRQKVWDLWRQACPSNASIAKK